MRFLSDTINKKILIPVLSLAFLLLIGLGVFMTQNSRLTMQAMMQSKGDGIADIFTKFSADYFAFFDFQDFEKIVNAMQADPDINHAVIFNSDYEPLTKVNEAAENMPNLMVVQREKRTPKSGKRPGFLPTTMDRSSPGKAW